MTAPGKRCYTAPGSGPVERDGLPLHISRAGMAQRRLDDTAQSREYFEGEDLPMGPKRCLVYL